MTRSAPELIVAPANGRHDLASSLWRNMDRDQRDQILWDAHPDDKPELLRQALRSSPLAVFATTAAGEPRAAAWLAPMTSGSKTGICHFAFAGPTRPEQRLAAGMRFLSFAFQQAELLLALIPHRWTGARNLALALGFAPVIRLPRICLIHKYQRAIDGILMAVGKNE